MEKSGTYQEISRDKKVVTLKRHLFAEDIFQNLSLKFTAVTSVHYIITQFNLI